MATSDGAEEAYLEPDNTVTDINTSSGYSDSESTRSASMTSSITGYKYENGRRYHAYREGAYYLPNDDAEQARLDLIHHIHRLGLDGALYFAPLKKEDVNRCLDFGTGTGIWAIDFADEFPDAEVIGTDLSPIQPTWVPPNLKFYVDDVEGDWAYNSDEAFDLIHGRGMGGAIKDWNKLLRQCYGHLKPGAYLELHDYESWWQSQTDPKLDKCPHARQWVQLVNEGSTKFGNELNMGPKLKSLMSEAGFKDVEEKVVRVPIGPWAKGAKPKEMGVFQRENVLDCVDSYTMPLLTRVLGWTKEDTEVLMDRAKSDLRDPGNQLYVNFYFLHGRKPAT